MPRLACELLLVRLAMLSIFDVLTAQHREVEELFGDIQDAIETSEIPVARLVFQLLSSRLIAGMHAEKTTVYPQLASQAGLVAEIAEAIKQHDAIERAINHVRVSTISDAPWCDAIARLAKLVADHADFEACMLFPIARLSLTPDQVHGLAADYERARTTSVLLAGVSITYEPAPEPSIYCHVRPRAA